MTSMGNNTAAIYLRKSTDRLEQIAAPKTTKDRPEGRPLPNSFNLPKHFEQVPSCELEILRRHHLLNFGVSEHFLARRHQLIHRIT